MVSRCAVAFLLSAFCYSLFRMASASVPENALPDPSGDASLHVTIPGAVAIVKRFQKNPLPTIPSQESPGQFSAEDPIHCALDAFASGTDNPLVADTSAVFHAPESMEPSPECPSALPGTDSPEPTSLVSAAVTHESEQLVDASVFSDVEEDVSIVDTWISPPPQTLACQCIRSHL